MVRRNKPNVPKETVARINGARVDTHKPGAVGTLGNALGLALGGTCVDNITRLVVDTALALWVFYEVCEFGSKHGACLCTAYPSRHLCRPWRSMRTAVRHTWLAGRHDRGGTVPRMRRRCVRWYVRGRLYQSEQDIGTHRRARIQILARCFAHQRPSAQVEHVLRTIKSLHANGRFVP